MLLFSIFQPKKLNCVVLFLVLCVIGNAKTEKNETSKMQLADKELPIVLSEQKSVKKELKVNLTDETIVAITPSQEKDEHSKKFAIIDEKSVVESSHKAVEQQTVPKDSEKNRVVDTLTKSNSLNPQHHQYHINEEFVLNDEEDISESLKTGLYFFLILSSAAIVFIVFKIYRLRLSRAERKYGVQGDRSTQELTPLPISIEDGHSDDEDQTLFDIQRQNVRIL